MEVFSVFKDLFTAIWQAIAAVWFVVLPVAFYYVFKISWLDKVQTAYKKSIPHIMLEIIPPANIEKSPQPMESFFAAMIGMMTTYSVTDEYLDGKHILDLSLEIVSDEGKVRMYIRTPEMFRKLVEAHIYAQYPEAEVILASDYTEDIPKVIPNKEWDLWGCDFKLTRPDAYPIKSYRWFEEDVTGEMIDPLANLIEALGKLGPGEKLWFQIIINPEDISQYEKGKGIIDEFLGRAEKPKGILERILKDFRDIFGNLISGMFAPVEFSKEEKKEEQPLEFRLTPGEKNVLKAIEESIGKSVYKTKVRFIYLGKRDVFHKVAVSSFIGSLKQFSDINMNGFWVDGRSKTYAIHLLKKSRLLFKQRKIFRRFKDRDKEGTTFYLNTEELATIFHLPDQSVMAPGISKIESKRGSAPANLPI